MSDDTTTSARAAAAAAAVTNATVASAGARPRVTSSVPSPRGSGAYGHLSDVWHAMSLSRIALQYA